MQYSYDATSRLDQGSSGATLNRLYETGTHRLQEKNAGSGSGLSLNLQRLTYSYDDGGNVATLTDVINSSQVQTFDYDWLDRLTSAATSVTGTGQYDQTYSYDSIGNITDFDGNAYTYDSQRPHAVATAHGNSYGYDGNGNQITRTIGSTTYTQVFDYENRLVEIKQGSTTIAEFVYDAAGNRITGTVNSVTTVYIAGVYEYQGGATTTYYAGPTGAVALRRTGYLTNNGIFYLLGDHLGSTSTIVAQNGTVSAQSYYLPYGGNRGGVFSDITTKRFTGQYHEASLPGGEGLSYYNARWYDAQLGRFVSADTIVPGPANPQNLNRFAYTLNNPLRYTDPSGHVVIGPPEDVGGSGGGASYSCSGWGSCRQQGRQIGYTRYGGYQHPTINYQIQTEKRSLGSRYGASRRTLSSPQEPQRTFYHNPDGQQIPVELIVMPPSYEPQPVSEMMSIATGVIGAGLDLAETASALALIPVFPDAIAIVDVLVAGGSEWFGGRSGPVNLDPSLPEMFVVGQDTLFTSADLTVSFVTKLALTSGGAVAGTTAAPGAGTAIGGLSGYAVGQLIDAATSLISFGYDSGRLANEIPYVVSLGFYQQEFGGYSMALILYEQK